MENNKNKKSVKFQGDMLNFCDFIQVFVFTRNHHLKYTYKRVEHHDQCVCEFKAYFLATLFKCRLSLGKNLVCLCVCL